MAPHSAAARARREHRLRRTAPRAARRAALPSVAEWKRVVEAHQVASTGRALRQLADTLLPLAGAWALMGWLAPASLWLALLVVPLAGLLTVRVFVLMHDCGHGSFLPSRAANDAVGTLFGIVASTPYHHWRWEHARHHATSGDLARRGVGDIWTLTVREYLAAPRWKRFVYRLSRSPVALFVGAPVYLFFYQLRFPSRAAGPRERRSVWVTNAACAALLAALAAWIGLWPALALYLATNAVSGAVGVWLFYVQHQYEQTYWEQGDGWDYTAAALRGSSHYHLPAVLRWFSASIGFHHVHHLAPRVPNYRLARCHREARLFEAVRPLTLRASLRSLRLHLWCEARQRLVGFRQVPRGPRA